MQIPIPIRLDSLGTRPSTLFCFGGFFGLVFIYLIFFGPCCSACEISVPWPGVERRPWHWKPGILIARPPQNSHTALYFLTCCPGDFYADLSFIATVLGYSIWYSAAIREMARGIPVLQMIKLRLREGKWLVQRCLDGAEPECTPMSTPPSLSRPRDLSPTRLPGSPQLLS